MLELTKSLAQGRNLSQDEVEQAVQALVSTDVENAVKAAFLKALRAKGETAGEIAAFARSILSRAIDPQISGADFSGPLLDMCGTGGDRMELFNVSTTATFVLAAGGAVVAKHGNRGITSRCGGADVLEELGVQIDLPPEHLNECLKQVGTGFLFAPAYHPAFKAIAPVRKQLAQEGIPTIFNMLGPLLNPARPDYQLVGVFSPALLPMLAEALALLDRKCAWVVHGTTPAGGVDEISVTGSTSIRKVSAAGTQAAELLPEQAGIVHAQLEELRGGDKARNAAILTGILNGSIRGAKRDVVLLNAGAAFVVAGLADDVTAGVALASEQIDSGRALAKLAELQKFQP